MDECKHELWTFPTLPVGICCECRKTEREIGLEAENERLKKALRDIAEGKHEHMLTSNPPKNAATEFAKRFLEGEQE